MATEQPKPQSDSEQRRQFEREWRRQRKEFELGAGQLFDRCRSVFSLTLGAPFRWCLRWLTSRNLRLVLSSVPAVVLAVAVVVLMAEARRADSSQLSMDYRLAAQRAIEKEDTESGILWLEQAVQLQPNDDELVFALAQLRLEQGDSARGLALVQRIAPEDRPGHPEAHLWMAQMLGQNVQEKPESELARIETHLKYALSSERFRDDTTRMLGDLALGRNRPEQAIGYYQSVARTRPIVNLPLSMLLLNSGEQEKSRAAAMDAASYFEMQLKANPDDWELNRQLAQSLVIAREDAAAEATLKKYADSHPEDARPNQVLAQLYVGWLRVPESTTNVGLQLDLLEKALLTGGNDPNVLVMLARLSGDDLKQTDPERAESLETALHAALDEGIAPGLAHFILGTRMLSAGKTADAIHHLEIASHLDVDVPETLNKLAWALAHAEQPELDRALGLIERALVMQKRPEFYGTRGVIFRRLGRPQEAIASFERSLAGHPDKAFVRAQLSELYEAGKKR